MAPGPRPKFRREDRLENSVVDVVDVIRGALRAVTCAIPVKKSGARSGMAPEPRPEFRREDRLENSIFMNTRWYRRR